jgi:hypothetical protein
MEMKPTEEATRGVGKLHNEEHHSYKSPPNIAGMMTPRRVGWKRHVACIVSVRNAYGATVGTFEDRTLLV